MNQKNLEAALHPPGGLSPRSTAIWRQLVPGRCRSTGRLVTLHKALQALDRADDYDARLTREGVITKTPAAAMPHVHPLARLADEARKEWRALWLALALERGVTDQMIEGVWQKQPDAGLPNESQNA